MGIAFVVDHIDTRVASILHIQTASNIQTGKFCFSTNHYSGILWCIYRMRFDVANMIWGLKSKDLLVSLSTGIDRIRGDVGLV